MFRHPFTGEIGALRVQTTRRPASRARRRPTGASLRRARRGLRHKSEAVFGAASSRFWDGYPLVATVLTSDPAGSQRPRPCPGHRARVREPAGGQTSQSPKGAPLWPPRSASGSCWRPASTSATRRAAGTPRCAASSSASAAGSTSSTFRRPSGCCTRRRSSPRDLAGRGGTILFVGTKKQARDAIKEAAEQLRHALRRPALAGRPATNFQTITKRIKRLHELRDWTETGTHGPAAGRASASARSTSATSSRRTSAAWRDMQRPPDAMFVVDLKTEAIGVREAEPPQDPDHRPRGHQLRPGPGAAT